MRECCRWRVGVVVGLLGVLLLIGPRASRTLGATAEQGKSGSLAFSGDAEGGYTFDTGVLRGKLQPGKMTLGLSSVVHVPSGIKLEPT